MTDDNKKALWMGMVGGAALTAGAWYFISTRIDRQFETEARDLLENARPGLQRELQAQLDAEVPPRVAASVEATFREYGLTPATGRQISQLLASVERLGLLGT